MREIHTRYCASTRPSFRRELFGIELNPVRCYDVIILVARISRHEVSPLMRWGFNNDVMTWNEDGATPRQAVTHYQHYAISQQILSLQYAAKSRLHKKIQLFADVGKSASASRRPNLRQQSLAISTAINLVRRGQRVLIMWERIDRMAKTASRLQRIYDRLTRNGVKFRTVISNCGNETMYNIRNWQFRVLAVASQFIELADLARWRKMVKPRKRRERKQETLDMAKKAEALYRVPGVTQASVARQLRVSNCYIPRLLDLEGVEYRTNLEWARRVIERRYRIQVKGLKKLRRRFSQSCEYCNGMLTGVVLCIHH